jgi:hemolysin activation/secretion protein
MTPIPRARRGARAPRCVLVALLLCAVARPAAAQESSSSDVYGPVFPVSEFVVQYAVEHTEHPPIDTFTDLWIELGRTPTGYVAAGQGDESVSIRLADLHSDPPALFHATALGSIGEQIVAELNRRGLIGVYVAPHPDDIDVVRERDVRLPGDTILRLVIWTGRIKQVRTIASGDRISSEWRIDNPAHRHIREDSPLQPAGSQAASLPGHTALVRKDRLEDYLFRLNRHPGRRVDASLAASEEGEGVVLDYLVAETKPWYAYAQASNTGTPQTDKWQERFGFIHNQLSGNDDTLSVQYLTTGFSQVHAVAASYDAPWFRSVRPSWLRSGGEAGGWLDPGRVPWWGSDRMRWQLSGSYSQYDASQVGFVLARFFTQQWTAGGQLAYNAWQHRALFLDLTGGIDYNSILVDDELTLTRGREQFLLLEGGLRAERITDPSTLLARVWLSGNSEAISGNDPAETGRLGRINADPSWTVLRWDASFSQYLEPLLNRKAWEDPSTPRSSTLAHELFVALRGQYAFGFRLIPQQQMVAGGMFTVRGYPQAVAVGDTVVIGNLEYRFHLPRGLGIQRDRPQLPVFGPFRVRPQQVYGRPDWDLIFRIFLDGASTMASDPLFFERDETLLGAGAGVELQVLRYLTARLDWGVALSDVAGGALANVGDQEIHLLFTLLY